MMQDPAVDRSNNSLKPSPPSGEQSLEVDVLHSKHPDVVNAVTVLTRGSSDPGVAFRQGDTFTLKKPNGKEIGGKAGDYILVFKVPDGVAITPQLIDKVKQNGIPSKEYWISIIDGGILNFSYSTQPLSENIIGAQGLTYDEPHAVYKAAGLKQKALIPSERQTQLRSLESEQTGSTQSVDSNELVLLDIQGNPYPKWANQFVAQFKADPSDPRSGELFERVRVKYGV